MFIVAYLYNTNGMASWCLEAAVALHLQGKDVLLVKAANTLLPEQFPVPFINFDVQQETPARTLFKKTSDKVYRYLKLLPFVSIERKFLLDLHVYLSENLISPQAYLLNQSDLVNKNVPVPQYVVAWAYKPYLKNYILKSFVISTSIKSLTQQLYNALYWYKADWAGYRNAKCVMPVSETLSAILTKNNITAYTVYPGVSTSKYPEAAYSEKMPEINLAIMALDIGDKRKGVKKIICALKTLKPYKFKLTIIGNSSEALKKWILADGFPVVFKGLLNRDEAVMALTECDVLLFGSLIDDWGFVQIEAMSKGLAVLAPDASPFDEIIGRKDYLFDLANKKNLEIKLLHIISRNSGLINDKIWFRKRYEELFASKIFGANLLQILTAN